MADIPGTRVHLVYPANNDAIVHYLGDVCARCINQNLYFRIGDTDDVTDGWQNGSPHAVRVHILYYDTGTETIQIVASTDGSTQTTTTVVTKGGTGAWKWASKDVTIQGAHLIWQNFNNADFYLTSTGELALAAVVIVDTTYLAEAVWVAQPLLVYTMLYKPYISDFTNADHAHSGGAQASKLTQANSHQSPDTDTATTALHHTLGTGANQAAAGNHTHTIKTIMGGHGEIGTVGAGANSFLAPYGSLYGTYNRARQSMPVAGTLRNFYVSTFSAQPGGGSLVFTLYKNGVAAAITVTVAAGAAANIFSDTTNTVTVAAGDTIAVEAQNNAGGAASAQIAGWTLELDT